MADPQQAYPPGSYPPEQQGYPQEPPPQQAYPQEAYPQQAYPQQPYPQQPYPQQPYPQQPYPQQAYPPQAGYPPDYKGAPPAPYAGQPAGPPPPYYGQQPPPVQAAGHQPQPTFVAVQRHAPGDQGMVLAVIATFIVVFFGCWFSLACTIPAIVLASNAQTSATTGDDDGAKHNRNFSYGLSTAGLVSGIAVYLAWIIYVIVIIVR